jgi:hypothetical protein
MSDARYPVFDNDGKYLYFAASTDSGPSLQPDVGSFARPSTNNLYLVVLSKTEPSPFAPESDEEKLAEEKKPESAKADAGAKPDPAKPPAAKVPEVKIDMDNIGQRILSIPMPARRYVALQAGKAGVLFAVEVPSPTPGAPFGLTVHRFDLKTRRADTAANGVSYFEVARNGEKMLIRQGENWFIRNLPPPPPPSGTSSGGVPGGGQGAPAAGGAGAGQLQTANIEVKISPAAEWKQMFHEAWRVERDFFYDPGFHGLDLKAAEKYYEPFVGSIGSRADLNYLFAEMLGNMVVGHLGVGGGEQPEVRRVATGLLGCDFKIENGRYRFARVFNGENWNPDARAPLTQPGVNVAAGEYLLAVNGRNLTASDNVYSFFEGTSGKQTTIRVGSDPSGTGSRDVTVVPIGSESRLRNLAWIEDNRRKVDHLTNGAPKRNQLRIVEALFGDRKKVLWATRSLSFHRTSDIRRLRSLRGRSAGQPAAEGADAGRELVRPGFFLNLGHNRAADHCGVGDLPDLAHVFGLRNAEADRYRKIRVLAHARQRRHDGIREILPLPGDPGAGHEVNKAARTACDCFHPPIVAGGRHEKNRIQVVPFEAGAVLAAFLRSHVGHQHAVHPGRARVLRQPLDAILQNGIEVAE